MADTFDKEFTTASSILLKASDIALSFFNNNPKSRLKADNSIVTEADEAVEAFLRKELTTAFPNYGFVGEETDADEQDISWIVDPIDGTSSFARGISDFANVLALKKDGDVIFSLIYFPVLKAMYTAQKGKGSFRNGQQIHVSEVKDLKQGLISINRKNFQLDYSRDYSENLMHNYHVRVGDHASMGSTYLSQGSIDVFIKFKQKIWDTAAEVLLMQEAGGIVTDEFGQPLNLQFSKDAAHNYIAMTPTINANYASELYYK